MKKRWIWMLLSMLVLTGCKAEPAPAQIEPPEPAPEIKEETPPAPSAAVIEGAEIDENYQVIRDEHDGATLITISITKPDVAQLVNKNALRAINTYYNKVYSDEEAWWTGELVQFAQESRSGANDFGTPFIPYSLEETNEITFDGEQLLSIKRINDSYTGGSHGNRILMAETFRKEDGALLTLDDIFRDQTYPIVLWEKIRDQIEAKQVDTDLYYEDWDLLVEKTFDAASYFLQDGALVIFYQPYDLAPFVAGEQYFVLPFDELTNEFSEDFLRMVYGGKK